MTSAGGHVIAIQPAAAAWEAFASVRDAS